jgi:hypothetical protein
MFSIHWGDNIYMRSVPSRKTRIKKSAASRSTNPRSQKSADAIKSALVQQIYATNSGSTLEPRINQLNPAKRMRNRVPPPQRERILEKYVKGKSIVDISKEEQRNRETVSKIVRGPEMQEFVRAMRERFYALGGDAISAIQHTLQQGNDGRLGFQVLASIGVIPSPEERQLLPASLAATGTDEEAEEAGVKRYLGLMIEHAIEQASLFGGRAPELEEPLRLIGRRINYETGKIELLKKKKREMRNGGTHQR